MKYSAEENQVIRNLLLIAAFDEGSRPGPLRLHCNRILRRALESAGKWNEQADKDMWEGDGPSEVGPYYRVLLSLIGDKDAGDALFVGSGDLHRPAAPYYTGCTLTEAGYVEAKRLKEDAP